MHTAANREPFSPDDSRKMGIAFADLVERLIAIHGGSTLVSA
jgi:hypothetical protein